MCVLSFIGDQYRDDFPARWPQVPVQPTQSNVTIYPTTGVSQEDFNALKAEVEELRILLLAAKRFDEATGQKDCEMDTKVAFLRQIAELVGVDLDEVFGER